MEIETNELLKRYKETLMRSVPLNIPTIQKDELSRAIDFSIQKRFKDVEAEIVNNYKKQKVNIGLAELGDFILSQKPIMTSYGCLFTKHGDVPNPFYGLIEEFGNTRNKFKKEMLKYPKGSEEYNHFNLLQLVAKRSLNAIYGSSGQPSCLFYNLYVAESITRQGKGCISSSIMMFESLLANNVKFGSLDEVVTFIDNVRSEKHERQFKDEEVLDHNISKESCFAKVILSCGYRWYPTMEECTIIWEQIMRLDQEDVNRLYYKNNMYEFCDNQRISNLLIEILCTLKTPMLDPNKPPEYIKPLVDQFYEYIKEYVYYGYQIIDKLDRIEVMPREVVLITDTDSCIISLDGWFRYMKEKVKGIPMNLKRVQIDIVQKFKRDEFGDRELIPIVEKIEPDYDYDFFDEKLVEKKRLIDIANIIPQDGLRHSIINIMSHTVSRLILDYMERFCSNYNTMQGERKCLMIMKNEFLFKSIMLTHGKKNYAAIQEVQEGHIVPKDQSLVISGLTLDKVGMAKSTSDKLKEIIFKDILDADQIDQVKILKELSILEKQIFDSINAGETKYHKPARIKPMNNYADPMHIQGIKASFAYNSIHTDNEEDINLDERNSIIIIKTEIDKKNYTKIENDFPDVAERIKNLLATKDFKDGIKSVAIPDGGRIPRWLIPFIDFNTIIHDNLNAFPLESIGVNRLDSKSISYSNILSL